MRFSMMARISEVSLVADGGFDCLDINTQDSLSARIPEDEFLSKYLPQFEKAPIPRAAAAGLFPGDLHLVGPDVDMPAICDYMEVTFRRAHQAGFPVVVFGSNKSRNVPEGFDWSIAANQILEVSKRMADIAAKNDVTIAVEPLRNTGANTFTTVGAAALLVNRINHPNFQLLCDYFHFGICDNDLTSLALSVPMLRHTHIATAKNRMLPGMEESDFAPWMHVLKVGGYTGVIAIEASCKWTPADLPIAAQTLRDAWEKC